MSFVLYSPWRYAAQDRMRLGSRRMAYTMSADVADGP
jgi:hypothetical protein